MKVASILFGALLMGLGNLPVAATDSADKSKRPISPLLEKFEEAACHRDTKTALALIDEGLDTKEADPSGNTALALAAGSGMVDVAKALVAHGADIHARIANDSILGFAIQSGSVEEVAFLLAKGVGPNEPLNDVNLTPLMEAARLGHAEMVTMLLARGADVKGHSRDGIDALADAAAFGHSDIIAVLVDHGADPNRPGQNGDMPLNWAAQAGYLNTVKMLVRKGARPDAPSGPANMTPLANACCGAVGPGRDHVGIIQFLLRHGARVSAPDQNGRTPLMHAAESGGRLDIIRTLAAAGADIHSADGEGAKALREALEESQPEAGRALLEVGTNQTRQERDGYSPLFYAIELSPNAEIVAALIQAKADVNATRSQQAVGEFATPPGRPPDYVYSALIAAVRADSVPMAKALLEGGANAHYKDSEGKTALDRAQEKKNPEMIALLAKYS